VTAPGSADDRTTAELTEATASGLRWFTLARLVTELLVLASMVVLARLIPPSAFGVFALVVIVQELALAVPSEGVGSAIVQRRNVEREHLQGGLALSLLVGAGLAAMALLCAVVLVRPLFGDEAAWLFALTTPWFLLGAILALPTAVLRRRLDFRRLSLLDLAHSVVRSGSSIVFAAVLGLDASALVLGGLVGICVVVPLALALAPVPLPRWRRQAVRDLLPYGGPAALACVAWAGFRNGDYAIVGARLGLTQAGIYWRGFQLGVEYQRKISAVMVQVAFPVLARTGNPEEMFALRRRMARLMTVAVFPLLALLVVLAPVVVPWLFGPAWEPAVLPTQILAGAGAATVVIDAVGSVLMAAGRTRALLLYGVAHFAVYVAVVLFAAGHGLTAVCIAAVAVHGAFLVVAYHVLLRGRGERTLRFMWDDLAAASVSCVALVAAAWPVDAALRDVGVHPLAHLALVSAIGAVAYVAALRVWFPAAARDLGALLRRLLPIPRLRAAFRRVPVPAGRAS
jgi:lipopolysaccharide exporter